MAVRYLLELSGKEGVGVLVNQLEGEELDVRLHGLVGELTADETLGLIGCVLRVVGQLVFGGVTHQLLTIGCTLSPIHLDDFMLELCVATCISRTLLVAHQLNIS